MNTITRDSHYTTCSGSAEPQEKFHKTEYRLLAWMPPGSTSPGSTPAPHSVRHSDFASGQFDAICRHDGHNQAESLGAFRGRVTDSLAPLEVTREHGDRDATFGARMTPIATYDTYDTSRPYTRGRDEEFRSLLDGFPRTRSISPNAVARGTGMESPRRFAADGARYRALAHILATAGAADPVRRARRCLHEGVLRRLQKPPQGQVGHRRVGVPTENARRILGNKEQGNHTPVELAALVDVSGTTIKS